MYFSKCFGNTFAFSRNEGSHDEGSHGLLATTEGSGYKREREMLEMKVEAEAKVEAGAEAEAVVAHRMAAYTTPTRSRRWNTRPI